MAKPATCPLAVPHWLRGRRLAGGGMKLERPPGHPPPRRSPVPVSKNSGSGTWILFFYEHTSDRETQGQVRGQVSSIAAVESWCPLTGGPKAAPPRPALQSRHRDGGGRSCPFPGPGARSVRGSVPESPMSMEEGMLCVLKSRFSLLPPLTCRGFYKVSTPIARPEIDSLVSLNDS